MYATVEYVTYSNIWWQIEKVIDHVVAPFCIYQAKTARCLKSRQTFYVALIENNFKIH